MGGTFDMQRFGEYRFQEEAKTTSFYKLTKFGRTKFNVKLSNCVLSLSQSLFVYCILLPTTLNGAYWSEWSIYRFLNSLPQMFIVFLMLLEKKKQQQKRNISMAPHLTSPPPTITYVFA